MKLSTILAVLVMFTVSVFAQEAATIKISDLSAGAQASTLKVGKARVAGYAMTTVPTELDNAVYVYTPRGSSTKAGAGFEFTVDQDVTVYLLYMKRGKAVLPEGWEKTELVTKWKAGGGTYADTVYKKDFAAGKVEIPVNESKTGNSYGVPHTAVLVPAAK